MSLHQISRALSSMEARGLLASLGRTQEFDRLMDQILEAWGDELALQGLSLTHTLYLRANNLWLDLRVTGLRFQHDLSVQLDSIDAVFILRERVRSFHALSAGALLAVLRERLAVQLDAMVQAFDREPRVANAPRQFY